MATPFLRWGHPLCRTARPLPSRAALRPRGVAAVPPRAAGPFRPLQPLRHPLGLPAPALHRHIRLQSTGPKPPSPDATPPAAAGVEAEEFGWDKCVQYGGSGFAAGVFGSALGLGGGVLMVPIMVYLGMAQGRAHGTSLVAVAGTSAAGAVTYFTGGALDLAAAGIITCTAIPTAILGAKCVSWTNPALLKKYFGWWLVVAATIINLKPYLPALAAASSGGFVVGSAAHLGLVAIMGLGGGFVAGLLGLGGGTLLVPVLVLSGYPQAVAQGTSLCGMVIPTIVGSVQHHLKGNVHPAVARWMLLGALLGGSCGGYVALYLPEATLRIVFCLGLYALGAKYIRA